MAGPQSRSQRFWGQVADAFVPGNAYSTQSGWNRQATITGLARLGGGMVAGPLGGLVAGGIANHAQGVPWHQGILSRQPTVGGVQRQAIPLDRGAISVPNVSPFGVYGPYAGGYSFAGQGTQGRQFSTGNTDHNVGYASLTNWGGQAPRGPAPSGQMGGGMSGGTFARGQADALTGDAARDYYAAMRMGSLFGVRQAGGNIRGHLYEK